MEKQLSLRLREVREEKGFSQTEVAHHLNISRQAVSNWEKGKSSPDIDNIIKIVLDAMNKFAFKDDTQVTKLEIEKKYAETPKIYLKIQEY